MKSYYHELQEDNGKISINEWGNLNFHTLGLYYVYSDNIFTLE